MKQIHCTLLDIYVLSGSARFCVSDDRKLPVPVLILVSFLVLIHCTLLDIYVLSGSARFCVSDERKLPVPVLILVSFLVL